MIYYPRMDWTAEDGCGTMVQEKDRHPTYLQYIGNRLIATSNCIENCHIVRLLSLQGV